MNFSYKNTMLRTVFFFTLLLLICSPSLSIVRILSDFYLPNEKIASIVVVSIALIGVVQVKKDELLFSLSLISLLAVLTCIRILIDGNFSITDLNTIVFIFGLPFYISFFTKFGNDLVRVFSAVVFVNLIASIFQQLCLLNSLNDLAMVLNNYPMQVEYTYPKGLNIFFRTSGLFNESSQYSVFLCAYIFLYILGYIRKNYFNIIILILSITDVLINESATAYIILTFIIFLYLCIKKNLLKNIIIFLPIFLVSIILIPEYFSSFIDKFLHTYNRLDYYPRLDNMITKIMTVTNESPFFGLGFTLELPSWDFISVYYYAYGIIGLLGIIYYFTIIFCKFNNIFLIIIFINSFVAGNILISVNLVLLFVLIYLFYQNDLKNNYG